MGDKDCAELTVFDSEHAGYTREICFDESSATLTPEDAFYADESDGGYALEADVAGLDPASEIDYGLVANDGTFRINAYSQFTRTSNGDYIRTEVPVDSVVSELAYIPVGVGTLAEGIEMTSGANPEYLAIYIDAGVFDVSAFAFGSGTRVYCHDDTVLQGPLQLRGRDIEFHNCRIVNGVNLGEFDYSLKYFVTESRKRQTSCSTTKTGRRCSYSTSYVDVVYAHMFPETTNVLFANCLIESGDIIQGSPPVEDYFTMVEKIGEREDARQLHEGPYGEEELVPKPIRFLGTEVTGGAVNVSIGEVWAEAQETAAAMPEPAWIVSKEGEPIEGLSTLVDAVSDAETLDKKRIYVENGNVQWTQAY